MIYGKAAKGKPDIKQNVTNGRERKRGMGKNKNEERDAKGKRTGKKCMKREQKFMETFYR